MSCGIFCGSDFRARFKQVRPIKEPSTLRGVRGALRLGRECPTPFICEDVGRKNRFIFPASLSCAGSSVQSGSPREQGKPVRILKHAFRPSNERAYEIQGGRVYRQEQPNSTQWKMPSVRLDVSGLRRFIDVSDRTRVMSLPSVMLLHVGLNECSSCRRSVIGQPFSPKGDAMVLGELACSLFESMIEPLCWGHGNATTLMIDGSFRTQFDRGAFFSCILFVFVLWPFGFFWLLWLASLMLLVVLILITSRLIITNNVIHSVTNTSCLIVKSIET